MESKTFMDKYNDDKKNEKDNLISMMFFNNISPKHYKITNMQITTIDFDGNVITEDLKLDKDLVFQLEEQKNNKKNVNGEDDVINTELHIDNMTQEQIDNDGNDFVDDDIYLNNNIIDEPIIDDTKIEQSKQIEQIKKIEVEKKTIAQMIKDKIIGK